MLDFVTRLKYLKVCFTKDSFLKDTFLSNTWCDYLEVYSTALNLLPPASEEWGKVMVSVSLYVHTGGGGRVIPARS